MKKNDFEQRHIGPNSSEQTEMLRFVGYESMKGLMDDVVPADLRLQENEKLRLPNDAQSEGHESGDYASETELLAEMKTTMEKNQLFQNFIGMGYYGTILPPIIQRSLLENPGWYTQYTPYQSEISQGRLESLLNFQTMVGDLTAMPIANASLLDEATAAAEAMAMLYRLAKNDRKAFFVANNTHPQTIEVVETRANPLGIKVIIGEAEDAEDEQFFAALVSYPGSNGKVTDYGQWVKKLKAKDIFTIVCSDLLSLCLLTPPGEWGADAVVGSSQRFGVPMGFGGPHAAFMACADAFKRQLPGRVIGVSKDAHGQLAYRMAMQTREQHIRRDKATSNICTAQALLANIAAMYAVYHGKEGLVAIARRVHGAAKIAHGAISQMASHLSIKRLNAHFFDTLSFSLPQSKRSRLLAALAKAKINARTQFYGDEKQEMLGISFDETTTFLQLKALIRVFAEVAEATDLLDELNNASNDALRTEWEKWPETNNSSPLQLAVPPACQRSSDFLSHPIFNTIRSEQQMQRYLTKLERKDISLTHSMIPLGSCTMKLNATAEMMPLSYEKVAHLHPFVPESQAEGYFQLIESLEAHLKAITGYAAISLQPNSGAQGEYAGLLAIRGYHASRGETKRNVMLIPSSAHGTNPASAVMAGFRVVVVACDEQGNISYSDVREKAKTHADELGGAMITYPSTYGVYEEGIAKICDLVHEAGGLVYMDGANMNAQVGYTHPRKIGMDVCHLNLHKTFAIPHGGGGPGVGPIGVTEVLAPFLPGHRLSARLQNLKGGAVSAAPWGSASLLTVSEAYIRLLGAKGLKKATEVAILNANYIGKRLRKYYEVLFTNTKKLVAHEMIIDIRPFEKSAGIRTEDVAKRLIDYGFHSPTMSWPVAGTLMIEPTESEDKAELDRFCEALIAIRKEIEKIEKGEYTKEDNPLVNAPHTAMALTSDNWRHPYTREEAVFPLPYVANNKFWPSVARVDNVYGDRNLICSCPAVEEYNTASSQ